MSRLLTNGLHRPVDTSTHKQYVAAVLVESALSYSSCYYQMVEFRGLEGLERKLRTGLRHEVGQWCIRVSRVSPPASSPRPSLPYSSLWPTSLTVKFNGSS